METIHSANFIFLFSIICSHSLWNSFNKICTGNRATFIGNYSNDDSFCSFSITNAALSAVRLSQWPDFSMNFWCMDHISPNVKNIHKAKISWKHNSTDHFSQSLITINLHRFHKKIVFESVVLGFCHTKLRLSCAILGLVWH